MSTPFSANYQAEAAKHNFSSNYYIEITGVTPKFSKLPVVNLSTVEHLKSVSWNPPKVRIDNARTSLGTITISLIDPDEDLISEISDADIFEQDLKLYVGFTGLDYTDYQLLATYRIREIDTSDGVLIKIKATDRLDDVKKPFTGQVFDKLGADLAEAATTLTLNDATDFPTSGTVYIDNEFITYTGKSNNQLTGLTRGARSSDDADHDEGADVVLVVDLSSVNPITILLQLLISPGGGGTYDVLDIGLGISQSAIDITAFEDVRDNTTLAGKAFTFEMVEVIEDALTWFESELLLPTNTRIFLNDDSKISIAIFDRVLLPEVDNEIDESEIVKVPRVKASSNRLYNELEIKWNWNNVTGKYEKISKFTNTDSQTRFGVRKAPSFAFKGVNTADDGSVFVAELADLYFIRNAEPQALFFSFNAFYSKQFFQTGDRVLVSHPYIINFVDGEVGIVNRRVEILTKKWDFEKGQVKYDINASKGVAEAYGFISPSSRVATRDSDTQLTLFSGEGTKWTEGDKVEIWDFLTMTKLDDDLEIDTIATDVLTFTSTLPAFNTNQVFIRYETFSNATANMKRFAYANDRGNDFSDGQAPYKIST